jgi:glycosyltransferase involved in cell wall biosynthesis
MLVTGWGIGHDKVSVVLECVDSTVLEHRASRSNGNRILGVADDDWVIGSVGTIDRRKGADLLPVLAKLMLSQTAERRLVFRWVGGRLGTADHTFAREEVKRAGLSGNVCFVGDVPKPMDAIGRFDVHVLLSREDPYPLVMLEAASQGCPTACFADAGGAPEFVSRGAGHVVPYLDLSAMSRRVFDLLSGPQEAQASRCRWLAAQHGAEAAAIQIGEVLRDAVGQKK